MRRAEPAPTSARRRSESQGEGRAVTTNVTMTPEQEIARLTEIRAGLAAQLVPLEQAKADATLNRRDLLLTGTADETATVEANRICRERDADWFAVSDAIAEADRRLADAIERRDAAAQEVERERVAGALERNAGEIETATAAMVKALDGLAKAHAYLAITVSGTSAPQFDPHNGIDSPIKIANTMLMRGVLATLTDVGIEAQLRDMSAYSLMLPVEPADPTETAAAFGQRLRDTARQVRSGETAAAVPVHSRPEPDFTPKNPEMDVYVLAPFYFVGAQRHRVMVTGGTAALPVPVAERALVMGLVSDVPTREWQSAQKGNGTMTEALQRSQPIGWDDCQDLGFDLAEWRRAEATRRRDAYLAEHGQEAA